MIRSYRNNGAGAFALTANCTDWAVGGLRSAGIYIPKDEYTTMGFADPDKLTR